MDLPDLEHIAAQLVARVHDDQPAANGRWLLAHTSDEDRWKLLWILAAAVPTEKPWSELVAWAVEKPVGRAGYEALVAERFGPRPGRRAA